MSAPNQAGVMVMMSLLLSPAVMLLASALERRRGPAAAGWVSAAPVTMVAAVLAVGSELGPRVAAALTVSAAAHVLAQVAFAVVFATVARRWGVWCGLASGVGAYVVGSVLAGWGPAAVGIAAGAASLLVGRHCLVAVPTVPTAPAARAEFGSRERGLLVLRASVAMIAVSTVIVAAHVVGPRMAGTIGAFPAFTTVLVLFIAARRGRQGVWDCLSGLVRGLPAYLGFCLVVAVLAPDRGVVVAAVTGLAVCLLVYRVVVPTGAGAGGMMVRWRRRPITRV